MSQLDTIKNSIAAEQIYFDITVSNFQSNTVAPQAFNFNESRTIPFVACPQDYFLSILRFSIDSGTLPVFIPSIQPNSANPNLTIYSVSMSWLDAVSGVTFNYQQFIEWIPQDLSIAVPVAPLNTYNGLQLNDSGYYNCYSYTWLCYVIYEALQQCTVGLEALIQAGGVAIYPDFTYSPVMNWDSSSNRAVLYANSEVFDLNSAFLTLDPVNIYFNAPLFGLFGSFPSRYLGYGQLYGKDFRILITDVGGTNISPLYPPQIVIPPASQVSYFAIATYQETSTTSAITPIQAIVFTSTTLPIQANQVSTPVVLQNNQQLGFIGNNAASANIITDIISDTGVYIPNLVYQPSAQYRLITLYGNAPLSNLDISVFFRLRNGSLIPFKLQSGGSLTMKLAFIKKNSYVGKL
jgi:hypothetical protein